MVAVAGSPVPTYVLGCLNEDAIETLKARLDTIGRPITFTFARAVVKVENDVSSTAVIDSNNNAKYSASERTRSEETLENNTK